MASRPKGPKIVVLLIKCNPASLRRFLGVEEWIWLQVEILMGLGVLFSLSRVIEAIRLGLGILLFKICLIVILPATKALARRLPG